VPEIEEPWSCTVAPTVARTVPVDIMNAITSSPDIVEELSDRLRSTFNLQSSVDFAGLSCNTITQRHAGPVVTVRYVPKAIPGDDQRLGHDKIAAALPADAIVVVSAHGCSGSVLGGVGAAMIREAQAQVVIIDGFVRDLPEIAETGLRVVGRHIGIASGRPATQMTEIGGQVVVQGQLVSTGDVAILNQYGMVCIPAWLDWAFVRDLL
jgi:regulator of RNase E activity RraA